MATSEETTQGQEVIECKLCRDPVSFFCRRCGIDLCDTCVPKHLRVESKSGHDVVEYMNKDEEKCSCDLHLKQIKKSQQEMSELSNKIDKVIENIAQENYRQIKNKQLEMSELSNKIDKVISSVALENNRHMRKIQQEKYELANKMDKVMESISQENDQLQSFRDELGKRLSCPRKQMSTFFFIIILSIVIYQYVINQKGKGEVIAHREELHKLIADYLNMEHLDMDMELDDLIMAALLKQKTEFEEVIRKIEQKVSHATVSDRKILEVPPVSSVVDTGFPAYKKNKSRLFDMAVTDDKKVWVRGASRELKLFDLQGNLHRTVTTTSWGMYIGMYNKQVVYTGTNAVKKISDDDTVVTMFTTGEWKPYGITGTAFCGLLVCLRKADESKVVRYSSTGTVLQEIQYDSHGEPLYQWALYITENVNGDIIVTEYKKKIVTTVDKIGIFRYSYSGEKNSFFPQVVVTDSVGHVFVADFWGDKIHMLDMDGRFLRYIIPEGGIKRPRALAMINDHEMIIGECNTGLAKKINF